MNWSFLYLYLSVYLSLLLSLSLSPSHFFYYLSESILPYSSTGPLDLRTHTSKKESLPHMKRSKLVALFSILFSFLFICDLFLFFPCLFYTFYYFFLSVSSRKICPLLKYHLCLSTYRMCLQVSLFPHPSLNSFLFKHFYLSIFLSFFLSFFLSSFLCLRISSKASMGSRQNLNDLAGGIFNHR